MPTGEWKAHTTEYIYTIYERNQSHEIKPAIAWHYHPSSPVMGDPHIHVYGRGMAFERTLEKLHIPSERVAFEMVVRFLVDDLGVTPNRADWRDLVEDSLSWFVRFRTWPHSAPANTSEQD